jgi:hypothetical protein
MILICDTTPNGHFKNEIYITDGLFKKIDDLLKCDTKCDNGFNAFVLKKYSLALGCNHYNKIKHLLR